MFSFSGADFDNSPVVTVKTGNAAATFRYINGDKIGTIVIGSTVVVSLTTAYARLVLGKLSVNAPAGFVAESLQQQGKPHGHVASERGDVAFAILC